MASAKLRELQAQRASVEDDMAALNKQDAVLAEYANTVDGVSVDADGLARFLFMYATKQKEFYGKKKELEAAKKKLLVDIANEAAPRTDIMIGVHVFARLNINHVLESPFDAVGTPLRLYGG